MLDLQNEDLIVPKGLGADNRGTVSKAFHTTTKVIKASRQCAASGPLSQPNAVCAALYVRATTLAKQGPSGGGGSKDGRSGTHSEGA